MVMIDQRPAEAEGRLVAGHWEGDLIVGRGHGSAIGTLVERASRYLLLVHLPAGHTAPVMLEALTASMNALPSALKRSLTWDQGVEMGAHHLFTGTTGIPVYFCQRASPWQRGSNENANGLLRQYLPKGTDLSVYGRGDLDAVAARLNARPRKTLGWLTPAERLRQLVPEHAGGLRGTAQPA
jgi:IS30 family transposase